MCVVLPKAITFLSRRLNSSVSYSPFTKSETTGFNSVFHKIVRDLTKRKSEVPDYYNRLERVLNYTVPHGKLVRGLTAVMAFKTFAKPENLTPKNIELANILGWCVEILHGSLLIIDDIVDRSDTRRGHICWYKCPDVGLSAITDSLSLDQLVYQILKIYFSQHYSYLPIIEVFHEITWKATIGQTLDNTTDLDHFTMPRYKNIAKYKTSVSTFLLPTTAAMHLAQCYNSELSEQVEEGATALGILFQVENDFLDCFADPGKIGTDISEGRCTWLITVALQNANAAQRSILKENYGRPEAEAAKKVQNVYEELNIPKIYMEYRQNALKDIEAQIRNMNSPIIRTIFLELMKFVFKVRT